MSNPALQPLDLFGVPPANWWARQVCCILGAHTFHWGIIVTPDRDGYITSESLGKGTSIARLDYPKVYCWRILGLPPVPIISDDIYSVHSEYGDLPYNMEVNFLTGLWWLSLHLLHKAIPVIKEPPYNCVGWVVCLPYEVTDRLFGEGVQIIPEDEYATPYNLENSPRLKYLGEYHNG